MSLAQRIESGWYKGAWWLWLLLPFSLLFWLLSALRRWLFKVGVKSASKPPVPVIVVGNISVGGNGKTPIVVAICEYLQEQGYKVGVLSRGYGGSQSQFPYLVKAADPPSFIGDEPALMYQRLQLPVVIDPERARGAQYLYEHGCNLIVCDDGLQHFALKRDIEWVVMDSRMLGNGLLLPAGPLRELASRLANVDGVVFNSCSATERYNDHQYEMALEAQQVINVSDPSKQVRVEVFRQQNPDVVSMCAIGNPARFKQTLQSLNITTSKDHRFIDHHQFVATDMPSEVTIMTEKDAVKCRSFAHKDCWYLKVSAQLPASFYAHLTAKLNTIRTTEHRV